VSRRRLAAGFAALLLAACATTPFRQPERPSSSLTRLAGWDAENHVAALAAVRYACREAPQRGRGRGCVEALTAGRLGEDAARNFLERHYRAEPVDGAGLLTGYFSPAYEARSAPQGEFTAPVRPTPQYDQAGPARAAIERTPAPDALAWMRPEDLFFLQVQGSGVLTFADGARRRAVFAGANGQRFVAIGKAMVEQGLIAPADASAGHVHDWLAVHRGPEAQAVMDQDPRYIYFRLVPDDGGEPQGAAGAALLPGRSLAVDPAYHHYFDVLWVDGEDGRLTGSRPSYQRLAVALDRGGAITGPVRADLYVGSGAAAGDEAARIGHTLRLYRIVPVQR
jgi:membrane-bound lytic murein transglycosylase A